MAEMVFKIKNIKGKQTKLGYTFCRNSEYKAIIMKNTRHFDYLFLLNRLALQNFFKFSTKLDALFVKSAIFDFLKSRHKLKPYKQFVK